MGDELLQLADSDLRELAAVLRARRLAAPFTAMSVQRLIASPAAGDVAGELQRLADQGFQAEQMAAMLELLVQDRCRRPKVEDALDLVTTGPEVPGMTNRDTGVVVRELFACAQRSVLVAGYAVYQGREVFRALADRMAERPELSVRMFLDVQRGPGDTSMASEVVKRFAERFKTREWPAGPPAAQGLLRPPLPGLGGRQAGLPAREVRRRRWRGGVHLLGQLHRGRPGAEHRDGPPGPFPLAGRAGHEALRDAAGGRINGTGVVGSSSPEKRKRVDAG